ncbi:MAG TPA: dephospho-CoA kinase [Burkholderiales bacterium]|nr:dephospho-CoA kinase [Burkholderiales bacterium]
MPFVVALTGGIGSGKSLVSDAFMDLGATVVDTDQIARQLTGAGGAALPEVAAQFGEEMLLPDGSLDRDRMRELVFRDPQARQRLEQILHPMIRAQSGNEIRSAKGPYVLLVVPLLVERGGYRDLAARTLVVDCDEELQVERVMRRNDLSRDQALAIMRAQVSRQERLARADDVITNEGRPKDIQPQIARLHDKYLRLARTST